MKVGVNLMWIVPGEVGGSEEYTVRLMAGAVASDAADIDLTLFVCRSFRDAYPDLVARARTVECPVRGDSRVARIAAESTWLAYEVRKRGLDLVHHAGGTIPPVNPAPTIVTIHDLQPLLFPENFTWFKRAYLRWRLPPSVHKARAVVTLSESTQRSVIETLDVDPARMELVPPGFTPAIVETPASDPAERFGIDRPFFLYPAITYPHKNHLTLVRAFAAVVERHPDTLLVLTSGEAQMEGAVRAEARRLGVDGNVRRLGRIARGDVDWLFQHAVAVTLPSRFEGFGMPALEAMALDCPVIAADNTAYPEVVGGAGLLLDPDATEEWTKAMLALLEDPDRRTALVDAGRARIASFPWNASVERLLDVYRKAAS